VALGKERASTEEGNAEDRIKEKIIVLLRWGKGNAVTEGAPREVAKKKGGK